MGRNGDGESGGTGVAGAAPFALDGAVRRRVGRLHPREVAHDGGAEHDLAESGRVGVELDAGQVVEVPLRDLPEHEVVLGG